MKTKSEENPSMIVVFKDGSYRFCNNNLDVTEQQNNEDWLTTIPITQSTELAIILEVDKMCTESLPPYEHAIWEKVREQLKDNRASVLKSLRNIDGTKTQFLISILEKKKYLLTERNENNPSEESCSYIDDFLNLLLKIESDLNTLPE